MNYVCRFGLGRAFDSRRCRGWFLAIGLGIGSALGVAPLQAQELCGGTTYPFPYTDVSTVGAAFCPGIMEAYVTGVTKGTTKTTFSPNETVTRVQMSTFLQRSLDQGLTRASRRIAIKQPWTNSFPQTITLPSSPIFCAADGESIWVAADGIVDQLQPSTGKVLGTWTGTAGSWSVLAVPGSIYSADNGTPGHLYVFDPSLPPGAVGSPYTLPGGGGSLAYDGANVWIANFTGSVSIFSLGTVHNYFTGFSNPVGLVYDGANMWVTDYAQDKLLQVDAAGAITLSVTVGSGPEQPAFDGENIWVPNYLDSSISVVQASSGAVVATILPDGTNLLSGPEQASFDGERMLVTNSVGKSVTIFKAADLSVIANFSTGSSIPYGVCSDGINFWVTLSATDQLLRY